MAGKLVHFELPAKDANRATQFYGSLFGWAFNDAGMPGMQYLMTDAGGEPAGAVFASEEVAGKGPVVYFDTDDIQASVARARELGGEADDAAPIPGVGWFARCQDTEGNSFSLFKADDSAPMPGGQG
jgi:predicted enzyme related to lactoylglutathione lyase